MGEMQLTLPGLTVKKSNALVRARVSISSKTASRILACLIAAIHTDDTQLKDAYTVPIKDYLPPDDYAGGSQYTTIKTACRELATAFAEQEWPDPENPAEGIFLAMPFFSAVSYRKGLVKASFNPKMAPALLQLKSFFTKVNLIEYLSLPSTYSQRLFEILKSWSSEPEVILSVADLHRMLDTPESLRANFAQFRRWVLEKAHKDILAKTAFRYEWEPVRRGGRSVEQVRFIFSQKRQAIAEAQAKKAKQIKQSKINNQRMRRMFACSAQKNGRCMQHTEIAAVCALCELKDQA